MEIEFIDSPGQLSAKQLTYKTFLNRKVGSLFSDHIDASELKLKNDKLSEALEAITLRRVWMDKGWFSAGYDVDVEALPLEL